MITETGEAKGVVSHLSSATAKGMVSFSGTLSSPAPAPSCCQAEGNIPAKLVLLTESFRELFFSFSRAVSVSWTGSTGHFQRQEMQGAGQNPSFSARHPPLAQQQAERTASGDSKANLEASAAKRGHPPTSPSRAFPVIQVEDLATLTAGQDPGKFGPWVLFFFFLKG